VLVTGVPQVTSGSAAGSFPQSFVDYVGELGAAAFWYSSGASTDPFKVALPLTVSYDASAPVAAPQPSGDPTADDDQPEVAEPTAVDPPTSRPVPVTPALSVPGLVAPAAAPAGVPPAAGLAAVLARPATDVRLTSAAVPEGTSTGAAEPLWWAGGALLLAAALVLLVPVPTPARDATGVAPERKPR